MTVHALTRRRGSVSLSCLLAAGIALSAVSTANAEGEATAASIDTKRHTPRAGVDEPRTSTEGVDVSTYGAVEVHPFQTSTNSPATMAVHGVQRVENGTVVYLSIGFFTPPSSGFYVGQLSERIEVDSPFSGRGGLTSVRAVVPGTGPVFATIVDPEHDSGLSGEPLGSPNSSFPDEPGVMGVVYTVLPPLPEGVDTVHVQLGLGSVVSDVPVGEGLLEPVSNDDTVIPLGTGWPEVDLDAIARSPEPEESVHPRSVVTVDLEGATVTTESTEQVTIDVAADVLFAFDSAELSPESRATLDDVADQISGQAAPGDLSIVGHTDSTGSDAYNNDLSRRRAQAVADALEPAIGGLDLDIVVEGRGKREPVAPNDSEEGRQANRRVTVTFAVQETP